MRRRRNAILAALELLRSRHANLTTSDVLVFAAVARGYRELGQIAQETGLSKETVSRCARSMLSPRSAHHLAPAADLMSVEIARRNNRTRIFSLNEHGRAVQIEIDRLIADADPIVVPHAREWTEGEPAWRAEPEPAQLASAV